MENYLNIAVQYFHQTGFLIDYCPSAGITSHICRNFWIAVIYVPLTIVCIFLLRFIINTINEMLAMKRLEKMKAAQLMVADSETLNRHKWKGLDSELQELDEAEISEKIRQSIKSQ